MKNTQKSSPKEMRILLRRMRDGENRTIGELTEAPKKEMSMRDLLKITRNHRLNEEVDEMGNEISQQPRVNKSTEFDQNREEEKFRAFFDDMTINVEFAPLQIYDDLIFWGGIVDGVIEFKYSVTPDESTSGVEYKYLPSFNKDNPENQMILDRIESYYDSFYRYWRDNGLEEN